MRSKVSFLSLMLGSFIMVIAFQNCGSVSENVPGISGNGPNSPGGGEINNCLAVAVPYMQLSYSFGSAALPEKVELKINNEVVYSDCNPESTQANMIRANGKIEFYLGFNSLERMANIPYQIKLLSCPDNISHFASTERIEEYSQCGTVNDRIDKDYVVVEQQ